MMAGLFDAAKLCQKCMKSAQPPFHVASRAQSWVSRRSITLRALSNSQIRGLVNQSRFGRARSFPEQHHVFAPTFSVKKAIKPHAIPGYCRSLHQTGNHLKQAYVAFGSNLGDRVANIEEACRYMPLHGVDIKRTSALYESPPMYHEDQGLFLNGVCEVETQLDAKDLLRGLKLIEKDLGRVKTIENGPRPIDLDILLYEDDRIASSDLTIPHPRIQERPFVLKPLCDMIPHRRLTEFDGRGDRRTFSQMLQDLERTEKPLSTVTAISKTFSLKNSDSDRTTQLMTILNMTPDSFSDGNVHSIHDTLPLVESLLPLFQTVRPPTIIDIGGQSTRPNADAVSIETEIRRILPILKALRSHEAFRQTIISVDTYRARVAEVAIKHGATMINDVSAGTLDPDMLPTIARLGCPYVMMHMRGDPSTMSSQTNYPNGVVAGVANELLARISAAEKAGIFRWRMLLDPGIGFAKNTSQNLTLIRDFHLLKQWPGLEHFPWVVGVSRKRFTGQITGVDDPADRVYGTAACVAILAQKGVDVVRVHDSAAMGQVVAMVEAIKQS